MEQAMGQSGPPTGSRIAGGKWIKVREPDRGLDTEAFADQRKQEFRVHAARNLKTERVRSRNNKVRLCTESPLLTSVRSEMYFGTSQHSFRALVCGEVTE